MIITITANPAVDISYPLDELVIDDVNRVASVSKTAGGKGLNVARVVRQLGEEVGASGFLGGSLGNFIREEVKRQNIHDRFVEIAGDTRNCIAILHNGNQTEILESGPTISEEEQEKFLDAYEEFISEASVITISGSLPKGLSSDFYGQLIELGAQAKTDVYLDTGGDMIRDLLTRAEKPFLIKPNESEFADIVGVESVTKEDAVRHLADDLFAGVEWVVVTLGADGAVVKQGANIYEIDIPTVEVVNPVGSGDAVIAGLAVARKRRLDVERMISFGLTMGVLNAMEETTGSVDVEKLSEIESQVVVRKVSSS